MEPLLWSDAVCWARASRLERVRDMNGKAAVWLLAATASLAIARPFGSAQYAALAPTPLPDYIGTLLTRWKRYLGTQLTIKI
jgi:hypothetical protein